MLQKVMAERRDYHKRLFDDKIFSINHLGVASNADSSNKLSKKIAFEVLNLLSDAIKESDKLPAQSLGVQFEKRTAEFIKNTFPLLTIYRPGNWEIINGSSKLSDFSQYQHLNDILKISKKYPELTTSIGTDYLINPDIVVFRNPYVNKSEISTNSDLFGSLPILHANISAKFTMRSDRAQNSRTEALNMIRNRKGKLPHIVVVTAEPLPSRIASIALGTGDIDCVYHVSLYELETVVNKIGGESKTLLDTLIKGKRLKDISDLPFDLAT